MSAGWPRRDVSSKAYCCAPSQSATARVSSSEKPLAMRSMTVDGFCPERNACMAATISAGLRPASRGTLVSTLALVGWQPVQEVAPDGGAAAVPAACARAKRHTPATAVPAALMFVLQTKNPERRPYGGRSGLLT